VPDSIVAQITDDLVTALHGIELYGGRSTAEKQRMFLNIGNRYPYIEVCGPDIEKKVQTHKSTLCDLEYEIRYHINKDDDYLDENTEISYLTRNVSADIIKAFMGDRTRSGKAQDTKYESYGYYFDLTHNDEFVFFVFVDIIITAFI
jgi:hypothetical protein